MKIFSKVAALSVVLLSTGMLIAADPTLSLKNKSADAIQIDVMQSNKSLTGLRSVAKNDDFELALDTSKPTVIDIHYCPTAAYCKTNLPDKMSVKFKAGKTIYVKLDSNGKLVPQAGNKLTGKTTAGYSTKNNVEKGDISMQAGKTAKSELGVGGMYQREMPEAKPAKPAAQPMPQPAAPVKPPKPSAPKPTKPAPAAAQENLSGADLAWSQFPEAFKIKRETTTGPDQFNRYLAFAAVLGVDKDASKNEFTKAYRQKSREWHPDKHSENTSLASDVQALLNEAYAYLK